MTKVEVNRCSANAAWAKGDLLIDESNGNIVIFDNYHDGTGFSGTVITSNLYQFGYHTDNWLRSKFTPFYGEITITSKRDE